MPRPSTALWLAGSCSSWAWTRRSFLAGVEAALLEAIIDRWLPRPRVNRYDGAREVDFLFLDQALIVEVDGWATHGTRRAFSEDRARDREHVGAGLRVVRFTAAEVARDADAVAAEIETLLARLNPSGGGAAAAASAGSSPGPAPR